MLKLAARYLVSRALIWFDLEGAIIFESSKRAQSNFRLYKINQTKNALCVEENSSKSLVSSYLKKMADFILLTK